MNTVSMYSFPEGWIVSRNEEHVSLYCREGPWLDNGLTIVACTCGKEDNLCWHVHGDGINWGGTEIERDKCFHIQVDKKTLDVSRSIYKETELYKKLVEHLRGSDDDVLEFELRDFFQNEVP